MNKKIDVNGMFAKLNQVKEVTEKLANTSRSELIETDLIFPSKSEGLVTKAIVGISNSFAILEITGDAPDPVPPPRPATTMIRLASFMLLDISSLSSSTAFFPNSAYAPVPIPFVIFLPILNF